jgi:restriction system protein
MTSLPGGMGGPGFPPGAGIGSGFLQQWLRQDQEAAEFATRSSQKGSLAVLTPAQGNDRAESPPVLPLTAPPEILIQAAIVVLGERTAEGHIIELVAPPWFEIIEWMTRDPTAMYQFDSRKWEEIIAAGYKAQGFGVILTPRSNDKGIDVIATRDDLGRIKIIEQVKRYSPGQLVPANDVRALLGVLDSERDVSKAILTTTSDFAPGVYKEDSIMSRVPSRLDLRPKEKLLEWLAQIDRKHGAPT